MRIRNHDGGEVGACGNATRCIADQLMNELRHRQSRDRDLAGHLNAWRARRSLVTVDMGPCKPIGSDPVGRGNGHPACDLSDGLKDPAPSTSAIRMQVSSSKMPTPSIAEPSARTSNTIPCSRNAPTFRSCNSLARQTIRVRVWERGAGITQASGSECVCHRVNAHRRGLTGPKVEVVLDGGTDQSSTPPTTASRRPAPSPPVLKA